MLFSSLSLLECTLSPNRLIVNLFHASPPLCPINSHASLLSPPPLSPCPRTANDYRHHTSPVCPPTVNDYCHLTSLPCAHPLRMTAATSPLSRVPAHCEWLLPPHLSPTCPPTVNDCHHLVSFPDRRLLPHRLSCVPIASDCRLLALLSIQMNKLIIIIMELGTSENWLLLASYSYHTSNLAGLFSLFCQATSLDANIPVCTFMRIIAIANSSKKRKGTSK